MVLIVLSILLSLPNSQPNSRLRKTSRLSCTRFPFKASMVSFQLVIYFGWNRIGQVQRGYYSWMSEDHKQLKLDEVYRELATIKQQLHALMQPNGSENNSGAFVKINIMQPMSQMLKRQEPKEQEKQEGNEVQLQSLKIEKRATCGFVPKREYQGVIHSPELTPKKEKSYTNHAKNKTFTQVNKESCGATSNRTGQTLRNQLKCMPKIKFSPSKYEPRYQNRQFPIREEKAERKRTHVRYATHADISAPEPLDNNRNQGTPKDSNTKVSEKFQSWKAGFTFSKVTEAAGGNKLKATQLRRIRSDASSLQKSVIAKAVPLSGKVRELEDELNKRDEAIEILFSELYQIEKNFKDMETILRSILGQHGNLQEKLKETNVNQALKEVLSDMELQGGELGRLNIQCEQWRKLNLEQEDKIRHLEGELKERREGGQEMKSVKEESDRLGHEMCVMVAKLEVAISENVLKDEFIVKFITAKNTSEGHNSRWVEEILKEYLKTCKYPRNGLLLKLREEEGEIHRLQHLLAQRKP